MTRVRIRMAFVLILLLAAVVCGSQRSSKRRHSAGTNATAAILAVLDKQVEAWNRHDLPGFMDGYRNSEQLTFFSGGTLTSGWQTTLERYRSRYQSAGHEMGQLEFSDRQVELLGPQSAFVRGHWKLKAEGGEQAGLFTLVFRRFPDGWKIIHDHTSATVPPPK